jgi:hypothetical protein
MAANKPLRVAFQKQVIAYSLYNFRSWYRNIYKYNKNENCDYRYNTCDKGYLAEVRMHIRYLAFMNLDPSRSAFDDVIKMLNSLLYCIWMGFAPSSTPAVRLTHISTSKLRAIAARDFTHPYWSSQHRYASRLR